MTKAPELETARLVIRPFALDDLPNIHRVLEQTFGTDAIENGVTLEERHSWLQWSILNQEWFSKMEQPPYGDRAIALKASGELIGSTGYVPLMMPFDQIPELGSTLPSGMYTPEVGLFWTIDPQFQKQGYATEAARELIENAFHCWHLKRILATTEYTNTASQAVMRKLGMTLAKNPLPEPEWLQVVGFLENTGSGA